MNSALNSLNYFCCCLSDPCRMGEKIVIDVTGHGGSVQTSCFCVPSFVSIGAFAFVLLFVAVSSSLRRSCVSMPPVAL